MFGKKHEAKSAPAPREPLRGARALRNSFALTLGLLIAALALAGPATAAEEEEPGTNISYPVIWSDGAMLVPPLEGEPTFTGEHVTVAEKEWYLQKDEGNVWQAQTLNATEAGVEGVEVSSVDWGDNLEAKSWEAGKQVRVETALYENLANPKISAALGGETTMDGYTMEWTNSPTKGPEEMWGTDQSIYQSPEALVYSACARLTIQRLKIARTDPATSLLKWDPTSGSWTAGELIASPVFEGGVWEGGDGPGGYSAEVNIQGKTIYGYNWKTAGLEQGDYRLTFSLVPTCPAATLNTFLTDATTVKVSEEESASLLGGVTTAAAESEGAEGAVDAADNLTYIDMRLGNPSYVPYVPPVPVVPSTPSTETPSQTAAASGSGNQVQEQRHERKRMRVTLQTQAQQVHAGQIVVLTGTASPARNGATVKLQQRVRTRSGEIAYWNVKSVRLRKDTQERSRFKFRMRVRKGTALRAVVPGNADYLQGTSTPVRIKVNG